MIDSVTKNPVNQWSAQKNLLILYTYTNLKDAKNYGQRLLYDASEMLPIHTKELNFLVGVSHI